jgi:hypothetical protein
MPFAHIQYGRTSFELKPGKVDDYLNFLTKYIRDKNDCEARDNVIATLTESCDMKMARFVMGGIADYPESKFPLIVERVEDEGAEGGIALKVISKEALEGYAQWHTSCIINESTINPF